MKRKQAKTEKPRVDGVHVKVHGEGWSVRGSLSLSREIAERLFAVVGLA